MEKKGFTHYSVRAYLLKEIGRRGMAENRDSMVSVANELRAKHGPSYVTDQLYLEALVTGNNCIIESIRTPGEIDSLRKKGNFHLLAVDAEQHLRYARITGRNSETDNITYETFTANEAREMNTSDPNKQNLRACIKEADFILNNDGTKEDLFGEVEKVLKQITG